MAENVTEIQTVVFGLGKEEYAIDIGRVQEIIRLPEITKLPNTLDYVLGIINLRGNIISVIDLNKRFAGTLSEQRDDARIIVVEIGANRVGLLVDAVTEVIKVPANSIVPADSIGTTIHSDYLMGVARLDTRLLILLQVDTLFD